MKINFAEVKRSPEFAASMIRFSLWLLLTILVGMAIRVHYYSITWESYIFLSVIFSIYTIITLISILIKPRVTWRSYLTIPCDIAGISYTILMVEDGPFSPFFLLYMWNYVSYSMRFDRGHLFTATAFSVIGFSVILTITDTWYAHVYDVIAYMTFLIVVPAYLDVILRQLGKARDEINRANRAKSEFLAAMSHEIRTPMSGIVGVTSLLANTPLSTEQREYLDALQESSSALHALIDDVLDLSKIEAGKYVLAEFKFNLPQVIYGVAQMFAASANNKGVELFLYCAPDLPVYVYADGKRLRQILLNLVSNAVKFTTRGEISIHVDKTETQPLADHINLRFEVRDTGPGIDPALQKRIFEPFYQIVDLQQRQQHGGTGLGTTISANLVKLMNGQIGLHSEPGQGSTFWFEVTMRKEESETRSYPTISNPPSVFIHESHRTHSALLTNYFQALGWPHQFTHSETELLNAIRASHLNHQPVLVMLSELTCKSECRAIAEHIHALYAHTVKLCWIIRLPHLQTLTDTDKQLFDRQLVMPVTIKRLHTTLLDLSGYTTKSEQPVVTNATTVLPPLYILLAEDSAINAKVITTFLHQDGHTVDHVENGIKALSALSQHVYDLVLMDMRMPELDGPQTTQRWRHQEQNNKHLPIIALTANATTDDRRQCLAAGMDDFLSKPASQAQLREMINRYTQR
jgi:two-component system sensor histidine kinase RpfC